MEFFDIDKIVDYTVLLTNSSTAAKVGFYLERHQRELMVDDTHFRPTPRTCPQAANVHGAECHGDSGEAVDLLVPSQVLDRSWEEIS